MLRISFQDVADGVEEVKSFSIPGGPPRQQSKDLGTTSADTTARIKELKQTLKECEARLGGLHEDDNSLETKLSPSLTANTSSLWRDLPRS